MVEAEVARSGFPGFEFKEVRKLAGGNPHRSFPLRTGLDERYRIRLLTKQGTYPLGEITFS